ncbi:DHA2 family efflux MFS transporter permease subunit [Trinickia caryophylli]|uniref:MFS transporter, DHA2 family, multidrug resistance protein n=1 Tax=Trinickia caryophylli TaxID=28094 RepID=A0A1X7HAR9_TRICW|nr:DHA2 family efflux MFS transporter permease subunit [Trinickia caryophylli]PMS08735.1 MFS transporter [Trinickia caryophylli]TRX19015.1 DHA2 family efflux MFS transporter permease subunit [Trinickia caryophylli]WQE10186.1 DHA2 family efflux MFS transporter permease subunit [Trinickia caryophylli]SMF82663.1 MFS transporter, DHA2 family, multidrug resistance protein [Trinickia caryophylli]GLU35852.1 MFS transporter [Trinickia caryophylli]
MTEAASTTNPQHAPGDSPPAPLQGARLALLTVGLAFGTFMEVLDTSIANVAVPTISGSLGVATTDGTWVISSYSVAAAIAVPLTGWLARRVGEVRLFTFSVLAFTIASALCGLAANFESLIAFRLLQGLVSGPMVPLSQTILMRSYPLQKRGLALGLWAMTVIVAPIFGPVMGGWITDNYTWPWIFYINLPIGMLSAASAYFLLRGHETATATQRIDAVGLALLIVGVGSLQMMLDLGKDRDWFGSTFIVTLALIATVALTFLLAWELTERTPIVDLTLFSNRNFALGALIIFFGFMAFFGSVVIFPLWLQTVMGYTAGLAGLATAPVGLLALVLSPIIGRNLHRLDLRMVASFAFIVFAGVSLWNATFTLDVPFGHVILPRIVQGIGVACFFVPMTTITLSSIPDERLASASGLSNFLRTLAGAIGTAISTTYWENDAIYHHAVLTESVSTYSQSTQAYNDALGTLGLAGDLARAQINQLVTQQGYMMATNDFFRISCVAFAVLAVAVWTTKPRRGAGAAMGH